MTGGGDVAAPDALRELVREVLRDVLPTLAGRAPGAARPAPPTAGSASTGSASTGSASTGPASTGPELPGSGAAVQAVRLSTDAQLHEFVLRVLRLAEDPRRRADIAAGRLRFTLAAGAARAGGAAVTQRVDKGAVTERTVIAAGLAGARLVLGPRAVLTPLARDKARALGVPVEKER